MPLIALASIFGLFVALKTQVNNAQRVSDANNVQHTATELNSAMTALKAAIADKERT
ncbi:hypothetical protein INO05_14985, partial [Staphylococcus aureus]|nr:hypothetical protein [Staphylococcus aureus]